MNSQTTMSATKARSEFFNILDKVDKANLSFTITVNGSARAVIMNADEFDSWRETLDIMSNPELVKGIEEGKKDIAAGRVVSFEEVFGETPEEALLGKTKIKSR